MQTLTPQKQFTLFSDRELVRLIIPIIVEQLLFITVGMADTMMISSQGDASVSGVSLVDMVNIFIGNIYFSLATGGTVVASQFLGARKAADARESAKQLLMVAATIALVLCLICELTNRHLLRLIFGVLPEQVMSEAAAYFRITSLTYPVIAVYASCTSLLRAQKCSQWAMYSSLVTNVLNVVGNYLFISVLHKGVTGAAAATLIARVISMLLVLCILTDRSRTIYLNLREGFHPDWSIIRRILFIGVPNGIEGGLFQLGRLLVVGLIASYGTVQIAANAVANSLSGFSILCGSGFCVAIITVIGQAVGAGDEEQCRYYIRKMMRWAYLTMAVNCLVLLALMPLILRCYGEVSQEALTLGSHLATLHLAFGIVFWPLSFAFPNVLRAANDVKFTMTVAIVSMFLMRVGMGYLLAAWWHHGAYAAWVAMLFDWVGRCSCFAWRYFSGTWKKHAHFRETKAASMP
ncbi:MAG: MATE family efflux transporter [Victivallales bacterium]|nr:MATE family efflux transporter [Victivallales bacterium]